MKKPLVLTALLFSTMLLGRGVLAETLDFGGHAERFKGAGDKIPPQCQVNGPTAADADFVVKWYCIDDNPENTPADKMRTVFWYRRANDTRWHVLDHFLGFPASVLVDRGVLGITPEADFKSGLPVSVRVEASDVAGNTTMSPIMTISNQDNSLDKCHLEIVTAGTESTGDTTGIPSESVIVGEATVVVSQLAEDKINVSATTATVADPCEIGALCSNDEKVFFEVSLTLDSSAGTATGTLSASPGTFSSEVSGTAQLNDSVLERLSVTGTADINDQQATVTFICLQS